MLSVARGKVSEGIDFDHNYGRAVIMFGSASPFVTWSRADYPQYSLPIHRVAYPQGSLGVPA